MYMSLQENSIYLRSKEQSKTYKKKNWHKYSSSFHSFELTCSCFLICSGNRGGQKKNKRCACFFALDRSADSRLLIKRFRRRCSRSSDGSGIFFSQKDEGPATKAEALQWWWGSWPCWHGNWVGGSGGESWRKMEEKVVLASWWMISFQTSSMDFLIVDVGDQQEKKQGVKRGWLRQRSRQWVCLVVSNSPHDITRLERCQPRDIRTELEGLELYRGLPVQIRTVQNIIPWATSGILRITFINHTLFHLWIERLI